MSDDHPPPPIPDDHGYRDQSPISEDWKFVTANTRIVVLPDPRLSSLVHDLDNDDQSSTSELVQGEGLDDLEYEYEPGISLQNLEFARPSCHNESTSSGTHGDNAQACASHHRIARCPHCGVDYESGKRLFLINSGTYLYYVVLDK